MANKDISYVVLFTCWLVIAAMPAMAQSPGCPSGGGPQGGGFGKGGDSASGSPIGSNQWIVDVLRPMDPNEIIGVKGFDTKRWVSVNDRLTYTILFENDPKMATAPAQNVFLRLPIDPKININSLQLADVGFAQLRFALPAGSTYYAGRLDVRDSLGLYVDLTAGIDIANREVFWRFRSIDPNTGLQPADPLKGMLPVNDTLKAENDTIPGKGEGFVTFSLKPVGTVSTGDTAFEKATIIFDSEEPILTNHWTNTIDAVAPQSRIDMAIVKKDTVHLYWSGQDDNNGSGMRDYALYVSEGGGPFTLYKKQIDATHDYFVGIPGKTYCFYTIGYDNTGNPEPMKNQCGITATLAQEAALPLTWLYFRGRAKDDIVWLNWATGSEQNTSKFIVERSTDGRSYKAIGTLPALGNTGRENLYEFPDHEGLRLTVKNLYYRIRQVDLDGRATNSSVVTIPVNAPPMLVKLYPNPFSQTLNILISTQQPPTPKDHMFLYSMDGKLIYSRSLASRQNNVPIQLSDLPSLLPGSYVLKTSLNGAVESMVIVKQ
ncbi:MAG: T9SS type A sorting domain-containing protein [Niastella sp.]|nr:T9SS type A sorting domain-containing protein [Niastella sp.]